MSPHRILIVEDEGIIAQDLQATLLKLGYLVPAIATVGEEAIAMASELRPDLVLMDIALWGGMDGVEAAAKIREQLHIPVIFLTAHSDNATLQRAKVTGPYGYLVKPVVERELRIGIEMALYKHGLEAEREQLIRELRTALDNVKTLRGLLPVCAACKKIRDDKGYWDAVDAYVLKHGLGAVSHSICPDCLHKLYPDLADDVLAAE